MIIYTRPCLSLHEVHVVNTDLIIVTINKYHQFILKMYNCTNNIQIEENK